MYACAVCTCYLCLPPTFTLNVILLAQMVQWEWHSKRKAKLNFYGCNFAIVHSTKILQIEYFSKIRYTPFESPKLNVALIAPICVICESAVSLLLRL